MSEMAAMGIRFIAELERRAGIKPGTIRSIRYGHTPSSGNLFKIANALNVSPDYLLTGKTDEPEEPIELTSKRNIIKSILTALPPEQFDNAIAYLNYLKGLDKK